MDSFESTNPLKLHQNGGADIFNKKGSVLPQKAYLQNKTGNLLPDINMKRRGSQHIDPHKTKSILSLFSAQTNNNLNKMDNITVESSLGQTGDRNNSHKLIAQQENSFETNHNSSMYDKRQMGAKMLKNLLNINSTADSNDKDFKINYTIESPNLPLKLGQNSKRLSLVSAPEESNKTLLMLKQKLNVQIQSNKQKKCLIYPNNELKGQWDSIITLILLFTCMVTPYRLAFAEKDPDYWIFINYTIDTLFGIDIILSFLSAYYTDDYELIEDRKTIAKSYIMSWFIIDFLAIFPFEKVFAAAGDSEATSSNVNDMIRLARLGRLYKILRLVRLFRIFKLGKSSKDMIRRIKEFLNISGGFSRLMIFLFAFSMICHIVACIWIILAQIDEGNSNSWMTEDYKNMSNNEQYLTAFYFTITTITTVGYGDISGGTVSEKVGAILLMILGVISFSFASASLSSILQAFDSNEAQLREKLALLRKLQYEHDLPLKLCSDIVKNLKSSYKIDIDNKRTFVEELPQNLRQEISVHMYQGIYKQIEFLRSSSTAFIAWICPIMRTFTPIKNEYIFIEGDEVRCLYFLAIGKGGFVLPKFNKATYVTINQSSIFGIDDIIGNLYEMFEEPELFKTKFENWYDYSDKFKRFFTVQCQSDDSEIQTLQLSDIERMKYEFPQQYKDLMKSAFLNNQKMFTIKQQSLTTCMQQQFNWICHQESTKHQLKYELQNFDFNQLKKLSMQEIYERLNMDYDPNIMEEIQKFMPPQECDQPQAKLRSMHTMFCTHDHDLDKDHKHNEEKHHHEDHKHTPHKKKEDNEKSSLNTDNSIIVENEQQIKYLHDDQIKIQNMEQGESRQKSHLQMNVNGTTDLFEKSSEQKSNSRNLALPPIGGSFQNRTDSYRTGSYRIEQNYVGQTDDQEIEDQKSPKSESLTSHSDSTSSIKPAESGMKGQQKQEDIQSLIKNLFAEMQESHRKEMQFVTEKLKKMEKQNKNFENKITELTGEIQNFQDIISEQQNSQKS